MAEGEVKISKVKIWQTICVLLFIILIVAIFVMKPKANADMDATKEKAVNYIKTYMVQPGTSVTATDIKEVSGAYQISLNVAGNAVTVYSSSDGKYLFTGYLDMDEQVKSPTPTTTEVPKSDKPKVELFVMSHCPYGTQAEKGILPVVEALGNEMDFEIKFVNYAMHGEKEVKEELLQYCIKKEQSGKYYSYLSCFLEDGDSARCKTKAGISDTSACEKATDTEFELMKNLANPTGNYPAFKIYEADNVKYGVQGSPTLVINGVQAESSRSPSAYLATICGAFNTPPAECEQALSTTIPSAGFGTGAGTDSGATC